VRLLPRITNKHLHRSRQLHLVKYQPSMEQSKSILASLRQENTTFEAISLLKDFFLMFSFLLSKGRASSLLQKKKNEKKILLLQAPPPSMTERGMTISSKLQCACAGSLNPAPCQRPAPQPRHPSAASTACLSPPKQRPRSPRNYLSSYFDCAP
jgi:hypothetical protein